MAGGIDGIALGSIGAGGLFLYAAIRGKTVLGLVQALIKGQAPATAAAGSAGAAAGTAGNTAAAVLSGGSYSPAQLQALWIQAGGNPAQARNAACHAMQESSGNPRVTSPNPDGGTNVGLWQLDTPGGKGAGYTIEQLQDPVTNARVTVMGTGNGTDWSAWATPGC